MRKLRCNTLGNFAHACQLINLKKIHFIKQNILKDSIFFLTNFCYLENTGFEIFNISKNNIIIVKVANVIF
jgi:hypothetical protein